MDQERVWDEIASDWRIMRVKPLREVVDFLREKKGKVLDCGCGTGRNFVKMKNLKIYGIDFSNKMIEYARDYSKKAGLNIKLKKTEAWNTGFKNDYFDAVILVSVLHCIETKCRRTQTIKEMHRVLKPGCEIFVSVWSRNSPRLRNKKKSCFIKWTKNKTELKRFTYIFTKKELEDLLKRCGFSIVKSWENDNINVIARKL